MKYLIAGLGNPGEKYSGTRHNIGFMVLDHLAKKEAFTFQSARLADRAEFSFKGRKLIFIKPNTYMNLSGKAINYWLQEEKIPIENLLVLTDDLALPLGKIRLKKKGSDGGHNGLKSIQEVLQTLQYPRLRIGIGDDFTKGKQIDYVLGDFSSQEHSLLDEVIPKCAEALLSWSFVGIERAMNQFN